MLWLVENGKSTAQAGLIISCCNGVNFSAYGYTWEYEKKSERDKYPTRGLPRGERKKNKIPIRCIETGILFDGAHSAMAWLITNGSKITQSGDITKCCNGKIKYSYGYSWEYV